MTVRIFALTLVAMLCAAPLDARSKTAPPAEAQWEIAIAADTLRYDVRAGEPLLVALPAQVRGQAVEYELDRAPALSWLVDRSFMWKTTPGERGVLLIRIRRTAAGADMAPLVLLVTVRA